MGTGQFKEQGLRILAYMQERGVGFKTNDNNLNSEVRACLLELGLTQFEFSAGLRYLSNRKLVIPDDPIYASWQGMGRLMVGCRYIVNPNPPKRKPQAPTKKPARKPTVRVKAANADTPAPPTSTEPRQVTRRRLTAARSAPADPGQRPLVTIDPMIQRYVTAALAALRTRATGNGAWLNLGVTNLDQIVYEKVTDVSKAQATRLVNILYKLGLARTCEEKSGGCSHVQSAPELVTAAMMRHVGFLVEPTVDELKAELAVLQTENGRLKEELDQKAKEIVEARKPHIFVLDPDLVPKVQYFLLMS
jgi:hypothetical protein